jgi:hypothetical protein
MKQLFLATILMWASMSQANIIEISTDQVEVEAGDVVEFSINLIDFEEFDFLSFSLDFDVSVLAYQSGTLASDFDLVIDPTLPPIGLEVFDASVFGLDFVLNIDDFFAPIGTTFSGSALLASFSLLAVDSGTVDFSESTLIAPSAALGLDEITGITIRVAPAAEVSAPATLGLFTAMLIAVGALRRKALKI